MGPGNTVLSHAAGSAFDGMLISTAWHTASLAGTLLWWLRRHPSNSSADYPTCMLWVQSPD
jgi:hypothetical protein